MQRHRKNKRNSRLERIENNIKIGKAKQEATYTKMIFSFSLALLESFNNV